MTFQLAHISDIHLSPIPEIKWSEMINKRITGYANWRKSRKNTYNIDNLNEIIKHIKKHEIDHLAITGDLVNLGHEKEIKNAWKWLKKIGNGKQVSVVCGNHDAYVKGALELSCHKWKEYMKSDDNKSVSFPYLKKRGEVAIIGVNSGRATAPLMATGFFRQQQADDLANILQQTKDMFRVIMIHHPPLMKAHLIHKKLVGASLFIDVIKEHGAELVIHGHTHKPDFGYIDKTPVVGTTAASARDARYNLFDIQRGENNEWKCNMTTFGFTKHQNEIQKITEKIL